MKMVKSQKTQIWVPKYGFTVFWVTFMFPESKTTTSDVGPKNEALLIHLQFMSKKFRLRRAPYRESP